jgi:hypothetical protein
MAICSGIADPRKPICERSVEPHRRLEASGDFVFLLAQFAAAKSWAAWANRLPAAVPSEAFSAFSGNLTAEAPTKTACA